MAVAAPYTELGVVGAVASYAGATMPFLEIKGGDYKARFATFDSVTFEDLVHFEDCNISIGQIYTGCVFIEPLVFTNLTASGHDLVLNPDSQNLVFKNCKFQETVHFKGKKSDVERSIVFQSCTFEKGLNVEAINITKEGLSLEDCTVKTKLDIFNAKLNQDLRLSGNKVTSFTRIEDLRASFLAIVEDNNFEDDVHVRYGQFRQGVVFNNGKFNKEVHFIHNLSEQSGLTVIGSVFEKAFSVEFHHGKSKPSRGFKNFFISSAKFNTGLYIEGKEDLFADDPIVENITIDCSPDLKGNIVFRNLDVGILEIGGYNTSANLVFEHIFINQIKIKALINNAGFILSGVKASFTTWFRNAERTIPRENALFIDSTNFGKAQFYQVDFGSFETIVFHNNILTEISTSLVKWFTPAQLESNRDQSSLARLKNAKKSKDEREILNARNSIIASYKSRQEIYRQLKYSYQKQGDVPKALEFRKDEMNLHKKILAVTYPRRWEEYFILWSNQTNDFGQNWFKPVWMAMIFNLFFFFWVVVCQSKRLIAAPSFSWNDTKATFAELYNYSYVYWQMFNPAILIHRMFKTVDGKIPDIPNSVFFWLILSKIFMAYFIYQTITAFRRFSK